MSLDITPISDALGAEIRGLDLAEPLDASTVAEIEDAWHEHIVLLFRDQDLDEDAQLRFAGQFGRLGERARPPDRRPEGADYNSAIMLVLGSQCVNRFLPCSLAHHPISIAADTKNDSRMLRAKPQHRSCGRM